MTEVARSAAEGVAAGRAKRAVTLAPWDSVASEVARSAAELSCGRGPGAQLNVNS